MTTNPNIYITCDKGNKGMKHFAKVLAWYNAEIDDIDTYLVDVDVSSDDTTDNAIALLHSLKRIELAMVTNGHTTLVWRGQGSGSGGGGILFLLSDAMDRYSF